MFFLYSYYGGEKLGSGEVGKEGVHITVNSFRGAGVVVKVMKQPGMENAHLLYEKEEEMEEDEEEEEEEEDDDGALWETISRWICVHCEQLNKSSSWRGKTKNALLSSHVCSCKNICLQLLPSCLTGYYIM